MAFYEFIQNNSGGSFDLDETAGITHYVIIEAGSLDEASNKAEDIGIYFNGVENGSDCACCGDRWHEPWEDDGTDVPTIYGRPVEDYTKDDIGMHWMPEGKNIVIHYLDGKREWL